MKYTLELTGVRGFMSGLTGMRGYLPKEMRAALMDVGKIVKESADSAAPVARLKGKHRFRMSGNAQQPVVTIAPRPRWAYVLIRGRGKNKKAPPVNAIRRWGRRHGLAPDTQDAAFALAQAIGRHGYAGRPYFGSAVQRVWGEIERRIGLAMKNVVIKVGQDKK